MNTQIDITKNGTTTLATAGKYCDRNIDVNVVVESGANYTALLDGSITGEYIDEKITSLRLGAFASTNFTKISLPNCTEILGRYAFDSCTATTVELPNLTRITDATYTFNGMSNLQSIDLSKLTTASSFAAVFANCSEIKRIDLRNLGGATFGNLCFSNCYKLETLILGGTAINTLSNTNGLGGTPATMSIYVPDGLVDAYKNATNWITYASRIKSMSELEE